MSTPAGPCNWAAVVPAAGASTRMGFDKTLARLGPVPVLTRTILCLRAAGLRYIVAGVRDERRVRREALVPFALHGVHLVAGGESRAATVAACLEALPPVISHVVVHDAARPHASPPLIQRVMEAAARGGAATAALPVVDTLHRAGPDGAILETPERAGLWQAQTPQAFRLDWLRAAHSEAAAGTDDAGMVAASGRRVQLVLGERANVKLTVAADLAAAAAEGPVPFAVGLGQDIHRLVPGRRLVLGGVEVPFERGLLGHSDADVLCHALADAVLGAAALGDIGRHFPPGDPAYAGADSLVLLARCRELAAAAGWCPWQVDCLVIAEEPRLSPHVERIRTKLAEVLGVAPARVNVKAGTNEGLGSLGRGEGIAAQALVLAVRCAPPGPV